MPTLFLSARRTKNRKVINAITPTETPTPIPAFVPFESPESFGAVEDELFVDELLEARLPSFRASVTACSSEQQSVVEPQHHVSESGVPSQGVICALPSSLTDCHALVLARISLIVSISQLNIHRDRRPSSIRCSPNPHQSTGCANTSVNLARVDTIHSKGRGRCHSRDSEHSTCSFLRRCCCTVHIPALCRPCHWAYSRMLGRSERRGDNQLGRSEGAIGPRWRHP